LIREFGNRHFAVAFEGNILAATSKKKCGSRD